MKKKLTTSLIINLLFLMVSCNNEDMAFKQNGELLDDIGGEVGTFIDKVPGEEEIIEEKIEKVVATCDSGSIATEVFYIDFAANKNTCAWGNKNDSEHNEYAGHYINHSNKELREAGRYQNKDGNSLANLKAKNRYFMARSEDELSFSLPEGAIICELSIESPEEAYMKYDDQIAITLNDFVLASSFTEMVNMLDKESTTQIPMYSWSNIQGQYWRYGNHYEQKDETFCLGGEASNCTIPKTETNDIMSIEINESKIKEIMALSLDKSSHNFKFITVGDNDGSDCKHSAFKFDVTVKYVMQQ